MEIRIAVAKIDKFGSGKSGDTVEVTERPNGGITVVLADGQINHKNDKTTSTMVSHRVIDLISGGMRDGAAIRGASNTIFSDHKGDIQANLNVISADFQTNTIIVSRNNPVPVFLINKEQVDCLASDCEPIGGKLNVSPSIVELPINPGIAIVVFSDGAYYAGQQKQRDPDICTVIEALIEEQEPPPQEIADHLLNRAIRLDDGFPKDDMSIIVMLVLPRMTDNIRRMNISLALEERKNNR